MTTARHALTSQASEAAIDTACRMLRLPTTRAQAADIITRAEREGLSYADFLAELLMAECEDRDRRRAERRIRAARFPRDKSLREFDYTANPNVDPAVINNLASCEWIAKGHPLCLIGDSGTGKSHLLIALGTVAAMAGHRVRYTTAAALVNELVEAVEDKQLGKTIARYGRVDRLEIDELGYLELDRRGAEMLFQVLTEREEKNSIAIASNEAFTGWSRTFTDPRLCAAIVDRLTFNAALVETGTESYRLARIKARGRAATQDPVGGAVPHGRERSAAGRTKALVRTVVSGCPYASTRSLTHDHHTMEVDTVKRIGIIGVGEIGRAIVAGLCDGGGGSPEVFLSPRGARTAAELSEHYESVRVCADNQEVVDRSEAVIIAVRRQDQHEALAGLRVDDDKVVVNVMAGIGNDDLRRTLATNAPLVRAIPLPSIRERRSVTVTWPSHPAVNCLFEHLGGVLPAADEAAFDVFSALTGTLTTHYAYLATLTSWAAGHGIASDDADRYLRSLFQGVGRALSDETRSLHRLAADHETPNGNNERIRTTWFDQANSEALSKALDSLLADLK